ncbi:MAG: hypothetical protein P1U68_17685 [Verrucomicrobiales bacterium]|nr:hypothetical protein [Verrucomicrobiales bacterium]
MSEASSVESAALASSMKRKSWGKWYLFLGFLMLYTWAYTFLGTILIIEKNSSRIGNPQSTHIESVYQSFPAKDVDGAGGTVISGRASQWLPHYTDGIVHPLWPWIMGSFASEPPDELFMSGKWLNMFMSCALMVLLGVVAARAFSFTGSAAIILMGGFGVILERSAFFSPDALYYLLVVLTWLCGLSLIRQNRLWLYAVFGVFLGLTFLTRPPIWPLVTSFVIVSFLRTIFEAVGPEAGKTDETSWVNSNQLVGFAMLVTAFLIVAGPRLSFANERFGNPMHSYQNYFVWMENGAEAARFQRTYPDRESLESLTVVTRPGVIRYLRENGAGSLLKRASEGIAKEVKASALGRSSWILFYGFFVFIVVALIHRWVMARQRDEVWRVRGASARWMLLFVALMSGLTLFYAGVANPVIQGNSMTTALFVPLLLTFIWIAERYRRQLQRSHYATLVNRVYLALMIVPILWIIVRIIEAVKVPVA